MDDSDNEIWEYKSLTKKHKTDENVPSSNTRHTQTLKHVTKSKLTKKESLGRDYKQQKQESSQYVNKEYRSTAYTRTSNIPNGLSVYDQEASYPISVDSESRDTDTYFCPICQCPSSIVSSSSHVLRCLEKPSINANECMAGLSCNSKEEIHYHQFKHSALALARSGQDFIDNSGNKSKEIPDTHNGDKWKNERLTAKTDNKQKGPSNSFSGLNIQLNPILDVDITCHDREEPRPSQEQARSNVKSNTIKKESLPTCDVAILELDESRNVSDMLNDALEDDEQLDRRYNSCDGMFNLKYNEDDNIQVKSDIEDNNFLFDDDDDDFDVMITQTIPPKCLKTSETLSSSQSAQWKAIFQSQEAKSGSQNSSQRSLNSSKITGIKTELPSSQNSQNSQGGKNKQKGCSQVLKAKQTPKKNKVKNTGTIKCKKETSLTLIEKGMSKNGKSISRNSTDDKQTVLTSFFSSKTRKTDRKGKKEDSREDNLIFTDCSGDARQRSLSDEKITDFSNNSNMKNSSDKSETKFLKSSSDSFTVRKPSVTDVLSQVESNDWGKNQEGGFIPEFIGLCDKSNLTSAGLIGSPTGASEPLLHPDFSVTPLSLNSGTYSISSDQPVLQKNASEILMASSKRVSTVARNISDTVRSFRGKWRGNQSSTVNPHVESGKSYQKYSQCPFYKKIPDTSFTVDAFKYGVIPGCKAYFLSHFHYDHYMGLTKNFSQPLYCSQVTANLVHSRIHVDPKFLHPIPLNATVVIDGTEVTFLEANHCPGSVLLLFKLTSGQAVLHTGDFRADPSMELYPVLQNYKIRTLYLDTTYCDPAYIFPAQQEVIDFVVHLVVNARQENPKTLIVCGAYTIGKERVFTAISEALNCRICVTREKKNTLDCLEEPRMQSRLSLKWSDSGLHVLPMAKLKGKYLEEHLSQHAAMFNAVIALEPTGWTFSKRVISLEHIKPKYDKNGIKIYGIPYSEHSSFLELKRFVQFLKPETIIPTVNNGNPQSRRKMEIIFDSWRESEQTSGSKNTRESKQTDLSAWI